MSRHGRLNHGGTMAADCAESSSGESPLLPSERSTVRRFIEELELVSPSLLGAPKSFWSALSALRSLVEPQEGGRS